MNSLTFFTCYTKKSVNLRNSIQDLHSPIYRLQLLTLYRLFPFSATSFGSCVSTYKIRSNISLSPNSLFSQLTNKINNFFTGHIISLHNFTTFSDYFFMI